VVAGLGGNDATLVKFKDDELGAATLLEFEPVMLVGGAALGVLVSDCLLELPGIKLWDFLDTSLRNGTDSLETRTSRALTAADSDRETAISAGRIVTGTAAALRIAEARRTKEVA